MVLIWMNLLYLWFSVLKIKLLKSILNNVILSFKRKIYFKVVFCDDIISIWNICYINVYFLVMLNVRVYYFCMFLKVIICKDCKDNKVKYYF